MTTEDVPNTPLSAIQSTVRAAACRSCLPSIHHSPACSDSSTFRAGRVHVTFTADINIATSSRLLSEGLLLESARITRLSSPNWSHYAIIVYHTYFEPEVLPTIDHLQSDNLSALDFRTITITNPSSSNSHCVVLRLSLSSYPACVVTTRPNTSASLTPCPSF